MMFRFEVPGLPKPQGSMKSTVVQMKNGKSRAVTFHGKNDELQDYRARIAYGANSCGHPLIDGAVEVQVCFLLPKPKSRPKKDHFPDRRPDIDKLIRAVLDGLTGVCFHDDAQVTQLLALKAFADPHEGPSTDIVVQSATATVVVDGLISRREVVQ